MKALIGCLVGLFLGAIGFHLYYLQQPLETRCGWDHPLDDHLKEACIASGLPGYSTASRHALDELVKDVGQ